MVSYQNAKRFLVALIFLGGGAASSSAFAGLQAENILTPLPPEFKIGFSTRDGRMDMAEYVPKAETVDEWSKMITVQIFHGLENVDAERFARGLQQRWVGGCAGGQGNEVHNGVENGYPVAVWMYTCPLNPQTNKPENMWMKVIRGSDALYGVQYAFRGILDRDMITPAMTYLREVEVCDTRRPDRPCPPGMQ